MDRLLTDDEIEEAVMGWHDYPMDEYAGYETAVSAFKEITKDQDAKTAHLVAQEIFKDYENAFEPTVPMSITYEKHHAIKSKWGIE